LLDIDGNGSLDQEEYNKGFDIIDKDHSGLIERSEFGVSSRPFFDVLDVNRNGVLDREEYEAGFAIMDIDGDGWISKRVFDNVVYLGLIPNASEEVQNVLAETEARRKQTCTYTAYFGKCNNDFCRKAIDDHYGPDHLCLDPAEAAAAVLVLHKTVGFGVTRNTSQRCMRYCDLMHAV
jgi:Ca2+-binding EF-hand superfamily protein